MTKKNSCKEHLQQVQIHFSPLMSDDDIAERERLQEERESTKQCLAICAKASEHLRESEKRLQIYPSASLSDEITAERELLQEEKESTEQCLLTCTNVLEHIAQLQSKLSGDLSRDIVNIPGGLISSQQATVNILRECNDNLIDVTIGLEGHIQEINSRLHTLFVGGFRVASGNGSIRTNVFSDVSAAQGAHQVIVSPGNLILATRVTAGIEGRQWLGQMSDGTLQRFSRHYGSGKAVQ